MADQPDFNELMKMAQKMQTSMRKAHEELSSLEIKGQAGAGMVNVVIDGRHIVKRLSIDDSALHEGKDVLEDLIKAALNDANQKVEKASQQKMMGLSKEFGVPGSEDGSTG